LYSKSKKSKEKKSMSSVPTQIQVDQQEPSFLERHKFICIGLPVLCLLVFGLMWGVQACGNSTSSLCKTLHSIASGLSSIVSPLVSAWKNLILLFALLLGGLGLFGAMKLAGKMGGKDVSDKANEKAAEKEGEEDEEKEGQEEEEEEEGENNAEEQAEQAENGPGNDNDYRPNNEDGENGNDDFNPNEDDNDDDKPIAEEGGFEGGFKGGAVE